MSVSRILTQVRTLGLLADQRQNKSCQAREAWRRGQKAFPTSPELKERLAIKDDAQLLKYVESQRSLEKPIETDLSFMDRQ